MPHSAQITGLETRQSRPVAAATFALAQGPRRPASPAGGKLVLMWDAVAANAPFSVTRD
jgi:hypothetical protein